MYTFLVCAYVRGLNALKAASSALDQGCMLAAAPSTSADVTGRVNHVPGMLKRPEGWEQLHHRRYA